MRKDKHVIEIKEEFRIPNTNIILEEGDKISLEEGKIDRVLGDLHTELSNMNLSSRGASSGIAEMIAQTLGGATSIAFLQELKAKLQYEISYLKER